MRARACSRSTSTRTVWPSSSRRWPAARTPRRRVDLRDLAGHDALLRRAAGEFGSFDVLAHVAGVLIRRNDLDEVTEEDWDFQHDLNLKATFFLNRAAARIFREQGRGGRIINFSSQGWWTGGFGGSVVYAATKGGIVSMSRGLARTYAKDAITVNTVSPGAVDTSMLRGGLTEEQLQAQVDQIPMGYMAEPGRPRGSRSSFSPPTTRATSPARRSMSAAAG